MADFHGDFAGNGSGSFPGTGMRPNDLGGANPWDDLENGLIYANIVTGIVGLLGNFIVLLVLITYKKLHGKVYTVLLGNQTVADLLMSLLLIILFGLQLAVNQPTQEPWASVYCKAVSLETPLIPFMNASTLSLVVFTVECYLSIVWPRRHQQLVSRMSITVTIVITWVLPTITLFPFAIYTTRFVFGVCIPFFAQPSKALKLAVGIYTVTVYGFIPVLVLIYCYTHVLLRLYNHSKKRALMRTGQGQISKGEERLLKVQKNLAQTFLIVSILFIICTAPQHVFTVLMSANMLDFGTIAFANVTLTSLAYTNCCVNPIVYTIKYAEFRNGLKFLLRKMKRNNSVENWNSSVVTNSTM